MNGVWVHSIHYIKYRPTNEGVQSRMSNQCDVNKNPLIFRTSFIKRKQIKEVLCYLIFSTTNHGSILLVSDGSPMNLDLGTSFNLWNLSLKESETSQCGFPWMTMSTRIENRLYNYNNKKTWTTKVCAPKFNCTHKIYYNSGKY